MSKNTTLLVVAGIVAGPFFIASSILHGFLRDGFNMVHHPASLLSLGEWGWVQIATFVITGLLYIALGFGIRGILKSGIGSRFVSPLFIVLGLAMIAGGVFTPDPSLGFPPGTAAGVPETMSWHAMLHGFAPIFGFLALVIALIILGRRFGKRGELIWMWVTVVVAIMTFILSSLSSFTGNWETGEFNFVPLWVGVTLGYSYTSLILYTLLQQGMKEK
ncbi:MAG: hypothetical protein RLZZ455_1038 [Candidatus Parcubacteria bacterium]|jgi:hypothetical protein